MTRQIILYILSALVLIAIGFGVAYFVLPNTMQLQDVNTVTTPVVETEENKFFAFVDTFVESRDMGTPEVVLMRPELDVIVFSYPTSQESASYGVYNYLTNELFMGIGAIDYIESQRVVAVLDQDRLLMWSNPQVDAPAGTRPTLRAINYRTGIVTGDVVLPESKFQYLHQGYGFNEITRSGVITLKDTLDHTSTTKYENYELNTDTLQLVRVIPRG